MIDPTIRHAITKRCCPICVAPVVLLSHGLFTFAHFMKEDTALLLGVSATLLAAASLSREASTGGAGIRVGGDSESSL